MSETLEILDLEPLGLSNNSCARSPDTPRIGGKMPDGNIYAGIAPETRAAIRSTYFDEYYNQTVEGDTSLGGKIFRFAQKNWFKEVAAFDGLGVGWIGLLFLAPAAALPAGFALVAVAASAALVQIIPAIKMYDKVETVISRDIDNGTLVDRHVAKQEQESQQKIEALQTELSALQGKAARPGFAAASSGAPPNEGPHVRALARPRSEAPKVT